MSVRVDLAEFLSAYVAEADEQLAIAGAKLLLVDELARREERDPRALRDLFRAMHTLKGLSGMVGVDPVVAIAHQMETVLREADGRGGALLPAASEVLLQGVREMERCVRSVEKGEGAPAPSEAVLAALESLSPPPSAEAPRPALLTLEPALDRKLDEFERDLLVKGFLEGRRAIRLDYVPTAHRAKQGLNINTVRDRIGAIAEIVRVIPLSIPTSDQAPGGIAFALLLLTAADDDRLATAAGVELGAIVPIVATRVPVAHAEASAPVLPPDDLPLELAAKEAPSRNLLRVEVRRVDEAMDRLATLVVTRSRLSKAIARLAASGADTRELQQIAIENARQLRDLRASILQIRMVPVTEVLDRIPLMLRALMRASGRQVRLELGAVGAELDKAVAERIFPAIVHLVRNAVDHGIESAEQRALAGKPPEGLVRITCAPRSGTRLELAISDDGRGIDAVQIARRAGVPTPETDAELVDLLCQPGFSTRDEATTTSGRGLGMDIVKRIAVEQLGGELSMHTQVGKGTRFTLQIPLTVAIVDAFVVECAAERFVVPVAMIEEVIEVVLAEVIMPPPSNVSARPPGMIERRGEAFPLYDLSALLGLAYDAPSPEGSRRALVIRRGGEPMGFLLDRVIGQQEAVIRPVLDPLLRVPGIAAATDLGDGRPTLVLDLGALAASRRRRAAPKPSTALPPRGALPDRAFLPAVTVGPAS